LFFLLLGGSSPSERTLTVTLTAGPELVPPRQNAAAASDGHYLYHLLGQDLDFEEGHASFLEDGHRLDPSGVESAELLPPLDFLSGGSSAIVYDGLLLVQGGNIWLGDGAAIPSWYSPRDILDASDEAVRAAWDLPDKTDDQTWLGADIVATVWVLDLAAFEAGTGSWSAHHATIPRTGASFALLEGGQLAIVSGNYYPGYGNDPLPIAQQCGYSQDGAEVVAFQCSVRSTEVFDPETLTWSVDDRYELRQGRNAGAVSSGDDFALVTGGLAIEGVDQDITWPQEQAEIFVADTDERFRFVEPPIAVGTASGTHLGNTAWVHAERRLVDYLPAGDGTEEDFVWDETTWLLGYDLAEDRWALGPLPGDNLDNTRLIAAQGRLWILGGYARSEEGDAMVDSLIEVEAILEPLVGGGCGGWLR